MTHTNSIQIRPMEVIDFRFIRRLAAEQFQFTRPPRYVLWLLKRTDSRFCMVAKDKKIGLVAYLLSLPIDISRGKALYVWQLAATPRGHRIGAVHSLLLELRKLVRRLRIQSIVFSAVPDSAEYRAIRRYAKSLSGDSPRAQRRLPSVVSRNEWEFVIRVK
jgi:hypothetical protein